MCLNWKLLAAWNQHEIKIDPMYFLIWFLILLWMIHLCMIFQRKNSLQNLSKIPFELLSPSFTFQPLSTKWFRDHFSWSSQLLMDKINSFTQLFFFFSEHPVSLKKCVQTHYRRKMGCTVYSIWQLMYWWILALKKRSFGLSTRVAKSVQHILWVL